MSKGGAVVLGENLSATGGAVKWPGGDGVFMAEATFGGGTVKLQTQTRNGTWIDVENASVTAAGTKYFHLGPCLVRVNIATATAVYAYASIVNDI